MISASVSIFDELAGELVGERHASAGIDVQAPERAPGGECIGVYYGSHHDVVLGLGCALGLLGQLLPLAVGVGQGVRVVHDLENSRIVALAIPGDADRSQRDLSHSPSYSLPVSESNRGAA